MKILMMTNTYTPVIGGVERSIQSLSEQFRRNRHEVMIVAPSFNGLPEKEEGVLRIPSLQHFNNTDFSVNLPVPGLLQKLMADFKPNIVHSHHPFLVGDIALRLSGQYRIPLVFTYHTMYEYYIHYLPIQNNFIKRFVIELSTGYANLANQVIVPSKSVRDILVGRGVESPIEIIPTGIDIKNFSSGDGYSIRKRFNIPEDAFVIGYVGRLAPEKNLEFLSRAVVEFLKRDKQAHFLIVGQGPLEKVVKQIFCDQRLDTRLHFTGALKDQPLFDSYHAMDIFAFASLSETQGVVLPEAFTAGIPVVAIDAPGARDIVKDQVNGRLVDQQDQNKFVSALCWCRERTAQEYENMALQAQKCAEEFSNISCAKKMIKVYRHVSSKEFLFSEVNNSFWQRTMRRLNTEWAMAKNFAVASEASYTESALDAPRFKNIHEKSWFLMLRRWLNKHEWFAKFLNLSKSKGTETQNGLVLIQIDGFSISQLQNALKHKEMPFLDGLLNKERYHLYPFYTGLPATTPSVQGELFYGVKQCVPAFQYYDQKCQRVFTMFTDQDAKEVESRLAQHSDGLLAGGSSYSNIFEGQAKESHFCVASLGWSKVWKAANPVRLILACFIHFFYFSRLAFLAILEAILAAIAFLQGIFKGESFRKEIKFIPTRMFICIMLRELITFGAKIDISRGLPVIHLNFLGYDEHSHRRGASSKFAHWPLRGIDLAIADIYKNALQSTRRHYDVWIYSDHGQEEVISYIVKHGRSIHKAIVDIYRKLHPLAGVPGDQEYKENMLTLGKYVDEDDIKVTAIGPTGNIYLAKKLTGEEKSIFAKKLVYSAKIPIVFSPEGSGKVSAWNMKGKFVLPEQANELLGGNHPYLDEVTRDLIDLCHHPDAGEFIFSGWKPNAKPVSFPIENGSHAGPGREETNAFALLPADIVSLPRERIYLRTKDLRTYALNFLGRLRATESGLPEGSRKDEGIKVMPSGKTTPFKPSSLKNTESKLIRIMTYNVHNCMGIDGKTSPARIARVIGRYEPDIVALQEMDMHRPRTGGIDQPHMIAKRLEMIYHFHPTICVEEERYGNAILSRYPMRLIQAKGLPSLNCGFKLEPRGAIWLSIDCDGTRIQFINTHLGLRSRERLKQIRALLGVEWIKNPLCQGEVILAGDFNALPNSNICRHITHHLKDAQKELESHKPLATWFSHYPISRIDHVFVSAGIEIVNIKVPKTEMDKVASDHLPLIVDLKIKSQ